MAIPDKDELLKSGSNTKFLQFYWRFVFSVIPMLLGILRTILLLTVFTHDTPMYLV